MGEQVSIECFCGKLKGHLLGFSNKKSFHVHCLCDDCQNFAAHLGVEDQVLDKYGGTELFQTHPSYIHFTQGDENLSCIQLKEKGLFRWYTSCCQAPVANTMASSKIPFVGLSVKLLKFSSEEEKHRILGPVIMKAFASFSRGEKPKNSHNSFPKSFIFQVIRFMIRGFVGGKSHPNPFFDKGKPRVMPTVLKEG